MRFYTFLVHDGLPGGMGRRLGGLTASNGAGGGVSPTVARHAVWRYVRGGEQGGAHTFSSAHGAHRVGAWQRLSVVGQTHPIFGFFVDGK